MGRSMIEHPEDLEAAELLLTKLVMHLNDWERAFVARTKTTLEDGRPLSSAWKARFNVIWNDVVVNRARGRIG